MMYWSVIGDHSHIEESAMDGSLRRILLEKNLRRPTGNVYLFHLRTTMNLNSVDAFEMYSPANLIKRIV